jgi:hypothetical protein
MCAKMGANIKASLEDGVSECGFIWLMTSSAASVFEHDDVGPVLQYLVLFLTNQLTSALQEGLCYMASGLHSLIIYEHFILNGAETLFWLIKYYCVWAELPEVGIRSVFGHPFRQVRVVERKVFAHVEMHCMPWMLPLHTSQLVL